ncbi:MAG: methylated-DNA--[protein]-cysteine S-methyltransferase [bacterium]|nr:methylated-DNA--[protein]-cysteine S-methyltransferase [bacterium]
MKREFSAGFIIFKRTREGIRYLLLLHGGDYWNFPKGHVEKNESDIVAAFRETREETGLKRPTPVLGFKRYEKYFFRRGKKARFKLVVYFLAEVSPKENVRISHEHEEFSWFSFEKALKMLRYRESKRLIRDAHQFLKIGLDPLSQKIYTLTKKIPKGKVSTYGEIARVVGKPHISRFVGFVLNKNTDPVIPCHRVVKENGEVGGYNKGTPKKEALLKREGVLVERGRVDLARFLFHFGVRS